MKDDLLAIIPARGGSVGLPGKHLLPLGGKPLIAYTIGHALDSEYVDRVVVTTDDDGIRETALAWGADAPFLRPLELADGMMLLAPTLKHTLDWLEADEGYVPHLVVELFPTFLFRPDDLIGKVVDYLERGFYDTVLVGLQTHRAQWFSSDVGGWICLTESFPPAPRDERVKVYTELYGLVNVRKASLVQKSRRLGDKVGIYGVDDLRLGIDIDDLESFRMAELVLGEIL